MSYKNLAALMEIKPLEMVDWYVPVHMFVCDRSKTNVNTLLAMRKETFKIELIFSINHIHQIITVVRHHLPRGYCFIKQ